MRDHGEPRICPACAEAGRPAWIQPRPDGLAGMPLHYLTVHPDRPIEEASPDH